MLSATNLQLLVAGITVGAIYALIALAFVVLYKATEVLNFALGEFFMLAAYLAVTFTNQLGLNFIVAVGLVCIVMALVGVVISFGIMRRLIGASFFTIALVTLGFGIIIRAFILIEFGPSEKGHIESLPHGVIAWGNLRLPTAYIVIIVITTGLVAATWVVFTKTRTGLHMRAVAENLEAATATGISVTGTSAVAWVMSLLLAAVGGSLFAAYTASVGSHVADVGLRAFPAVLVGGLDSPVGAIVGGLMVGAVEQIGAGKFGTEWRDVISFGILFVVIIVRPTGLFGSKQLQRL